MNDTDILQTLQSIDRTLKYMSGLWELIHTDSIKERLQPVLVEPRKTLAYQCSADGRSSRQVAAIAGVSDRTIRDWWREWADLGLVRQTRTPGRFERKFDFQGLVFAPVEVKPNE